VTEVERVKLPGVGVLHKFVNEQGNRIGVVSHRAGYRDLVLIQGPDDGSDECKVSIRLEDDEAHTLADLLGGTTVTEGITALQALPGLAIDWLEVGYNSACAGKTLGHPNVGGADGVSIVAVIRGDETVPSPGPDFRIFPGDTLVAVGRPESVAAVFKSLQGS
jgi:TrkA domain protein